ncbi:unnamed protein product [Dovyalis caffra]|uniref:Uncharacterized protein n=1 Tax=Dovyalis caffra TaxID=77055 RepID=A0AAV1RL98_9ROSI|nr:unnamed protein product [Dovyalis caffra]
MEEMQWLINVTKELQNKVETSMQNILWNKRSIYKVPASVTALKRAAYRPQTVSIGPYHYYDDQLKRMEEHKYRALHYFLQRSGKSLELFLLSLNEVVQDLKDSYDQLDKSWKDDTSRFLQLMILDGCFMLEIMRLAIQISNGYAADDPVFSSHGRVYMAPFIRRDMLIVENQLPMLVLYKLVAIESDGEKDEEFVNKLILAFCHPNASVSMWGKRLHVLDLYRNSLLQEVPERKKHRPRVRGGLHKDANDIVRSAAEISEAGIHTLGSPSSPVAAGLPETYTPSTGFWQCVVVIFMQSDIFIQLLEHIGRKVCFSVRVEEMGLYIAVVTRNVSRGKLDNTLHHFLSSLLKTVEKFEAMEEENQVLIKVVTEKLQNLADTSLQNVLWDKRSIYKIPASVTSLNKTAYMPQTVSFGPYHHDENHLKPMEEHKQRALKYFLNGAGKPLQSVVESLNKEIQVLKDSYDILGESWKNDTSKFLQLMILDGCFMLEIIRLATHSLDRYDANDPIFSSHGRLYITPFIRRDMLLLENQLPMLVLYKLVAVESDGAKDEEFVNKLILNFCYPNASVSKLDVSTSPSPPVFMAPPPLPTPPHHPPMHPPKPSRRH